MSTSRKDRWSKLDSPEGVASAARRLRQMSDTTSERRASEKWLEILAPRPGEQILDVGAGIGELTLPIARRVGGDGKVHALDLSAGLLKRARARAEQACLGAQIILDAGDAAQMPYDDGEFDAVFSRWLLLHVSSPARIIDEIKRVVRPGGRVVCVEVDWETLVVHPGDPEVTRRIVDAHVARQVDGRMGRKLVPLLRQCGLQQVSATPFVSLDLWGDWLPILHSRLEVAERAGVPLDLLMAWWEEVESAPERGDYVMSFTQYAVTATRAPSAASEPHSGEKSPS